MTQFYCLTCDKYRDSNTEDNADYSGEDPVCGECVEEREQEFQQWWQSLDADHDYINEESNIGHD